MRSRTESFMVCCLITRVAPPQVTEPCTSLTTSLLSASNSDTLSSPYIFASAFLSIFLSASHFTLFLHPHLPSTPIHPHPHNQTINPSTHQPINNHNNVPHYP